LINIPNPEQKLTILDGVKSYTIWAAYSTFQEDTKGSIEKGKFADMVVLSDDIFIIPDSALLNTKVIMTIVNGNIVYENKDNAIK
jgi:hypothetical protein